MWNLFNKKNKTDGEHRTLQLITDKKMPFGYVEAYKSLRTNLDLWQAPWMCTRWSSPVPCRKSPRAMWRSIWR